MIAWFPSGAEFSGLVEAFRRAYRLGEVWVEYPSGWPMEVVEAAQALARTRHAAHHASEGWMRGRATLFRGGLSQE
jgi:hypothetical protein